MDAIATYRVVGITDDVDTCECCGRTGLKATVALMDAEGEVTYFGRSCAAKAAGWTVKEVGTKIVEAQVAVRNLDSERRCQGKYAADAALQAYLDATFPEVPATARKFHASQTMGAAAMREAAGCEAARVAAEDAFVVAMKALA